MSTVLRSMVEKRMVTNIEHLNLKGRKQVLAFCEKLNLKTSTCGEGTMLNLEKIPDDKLNQIDGLISALLLVQRSFSETI